MVVAFREISVLPMPLNNKRKTELPNPAERCDRIEKLTKVGAKLYSGPKNVKTKSLDSTAIATDKGT